jgi:tRNA(adenine34) deaminase
MNYRDDEYFMRLALEEAESAFLEGEIPVGAVLVKDGQIIAKSHNAKELNSDPTAHAELIVLRKGAAILKNWRLTDTALYVTKEPCIMCSGAMINARLGKLIFGCNDERYGAVLSRFRLLSDPSLNHQIPIVSGILTDDCADILKKFFLKLREPSEYQN